MTVVRVPPVLRQEAGGAREVDAEGETLRELLEDLHARLPALGARVYAQGEIQPFVNVYVDGEDVRTRDGLETPVRNGSTVILLPAMAGGSRGPLAGVRSRAEPAPAPAKPAPPLFAGSVEPPPVEPPSADACRP